jgi:hypothetical protein
VQSGARSALFVTMLVVCGTYSSQCHERRAEHLRCCVAINEHKRQHEVHGARKLESGEQRLRQMHLYRNELEQEKARVCVCVCVCVCVWCVCVCVCGVCVRVHARDRAAWRMVQYSPTRSAMHFAAGHNGGRLRVQTAE